MTSRGREQKRMAILVADRIRDLGLQLPAQVLLEAGRPFAFLAGQLVWVIQPLLALMMPRGEVARVAELLEDKESVSVLIDLLGREPGDSVGGM